MRIFLLLLSWAMFSSGMLAEDAATFTPRSVAVRADGTLIISDDVKYRILGLDPTGVLSVQLERGTVDPGSGRKVDLGRPVGIALDGAGNLYLTDRNTHRIFRIDRQSGAVTTVAGNREFGYRYDDVAATEASLSTPVGVTLDREGNLYFVEQSSRRVRRVDAGTGRIATVAGSGRTGFSGDGGPATEAAFEVPFDVAVDRRGNLFIADTGNHRIRRVDAGTGLISTYAGNGKGGFGGDGGPAAKASLYDPFSVALDRSGNLYIADRGNHRVRRVGARNRVITTVAGNGQRGFSGDGGPARRASLADPFDLTVDRRGNLYIADTGNKRVRRVNARTRRIETVPVKAPSKEEPASEDKKESQSS
ncbi:MAG: hypothetical protein F4X19_16915 [Acidobacteria bacterium]|nr:hypothetical protein [Acidobacteriota bacterium]